MEKQIRTAYQRGCADRMLHGADAMAAMYADASGRYDSYGQDEWSAWRIGFADDELEVIYGYRYGEIPACGRSRNHATGDMEWGVSLMDTLEGWGCTNMMRMDAIALDDRGIVWIRGYFAGCGSDGEPLVFAAQKMS